MRTGDRIVGRNGTKGNNDWENVKSKRSLTLKLKSKNWRRNKRTDTLVFLQTFLSKASYKKTLTELLEETLPISIIAHLIKRVAEREKPLASSLTCQFEGKEETVSFEDPISLYELSEGLGISKEKIDESLSCTKGCKTKRLSTEIFDGFFETHISRLADAAFKRKRERELRDPKRREATINWKLALQKLKNIFETTKRNLLCESEIGVSFGETETVIETNENIEELTTTRRGKKRPRSFSSTELRKEEQSERKIKQYDVLIKAEDIITEAQQVEDIDPKDGPFKLKWKAKWKVFGDLLAGEAKQEKTKKSKIEESCEKNTSRIYVMESCIEERETEENVYNETNGIEREDWMPPANFYRRHEIKELPKEEINDYGRKTTRYFASFSEAVLSKGQSETNRSILSSSASTGIDYESIEFCGWKLKTLEDGETIVLMVHGRYADTWDFEVSASLLWNDMEARNIVKNLGFDLSMAKILANKIEAGLSEIENEECFKEYKKTKSWEVNHQVNVTEESKLEEQSLCLETNLCGPEEDKTVKEIANSRGLFSMNLDEVKKVYCDVYKTKKKK